MNSASDKHTNQIENEVKLRDQVYLRIPVKTRIITVQDNLENIINEYIVNYTKEDKISSIFAVCLASKIVCICTPKYRFHKDEIKIGLLARIVEKFVTYHPNDFGYKNARKIQLAIKIVGLPRFVLAVVIGGIMKFIFRKPGYFYIIAGNNISKIDGFIPDDFPDPEGIGQYGYIIPRTKELNELCDNLEIKFSIPFMITDSNNIDDHLIGVSKILREKYSLDELKSLIKGNPHGQNNLTPILLFINKE